MTRACGRMFRFVRIFYRFQGEHIMKIRCWLYIALVVAVISLLFPKLAMAAEECTHDQATIGALRACVMHAVAEGHIDNPGVAKSLLAKLDAAQSALDRGQTDVAVHNLQ